MLGNHQLGTHVQLTNRFEEIGGAVAYINREAPLELGHRRRADAVRDRQLRGRASRLWTARRRSPSRRCGSPRSTGRSAAWRSIRSAARTGSRSAAGARRISFDQQIETLFFSPITGQLLDESERGAAASRRAQPRRRPARRWSTTRRCSAPPARSSASAIASSIRRSPGRCSIPACWRTIAVLHAGASVHVRDPRPALRPLWARRRRRAAVAALHRLSGNGARL